MSSATARDQAYELFLESCNLAVWSTSFDAFREILEGVEDVRDAKPINIRRALTLSVYLRWLSARCGDEERRNQANACLEKLSTRLAHEPLSDVAEGILIQAVIAAAKGYDAAAARILKGYTRTVPVEVVLLATPQRTNLRASALMEYVSDGARSPFIPAVYFFGSDLLDLGYQSNLEDLLRRCRAISSSSPVIDLNGQLFELGGSWSAARDLYSHSDWVSHAYRLAVCDLILGKAVHELNDLAPDAVKKFIAGMLEFSGETDRAGIFRSAAFVRACRSSGFDNWLVHFELGRLGFQRRHHMEAEQHLVAAARTAPLQYRFPIHSLRFTNLTWIGEALDLPLDPEALEAGFAALQEAPNGAHCADIRTWMARREGEFELLEPVAASGDNFEVGNANHILGSIPDALACWCACIASQYTPRAVFMLLKIFASYGFEKTAAALAETVELQSDASFFDLWELARALTELLQTQPPERLDGKLLLERLKQVEVRMEERVESQFQNAIRAFHYFLERRRHSRAHHMLARAERLAEGSEEFLLLAIARRKLVGGGLDRRAIEALQRAQSQSNNRFERLVIAREFVTWGDLAQARSILQQEGAFSGHGDLTPIEYVVALQCAKLCCSEDQCKLLEASARVALQRDAEAVRFLRYGMGFLERLNTHLTGGSLDIAFPGQTNAPEREPSDWLLARLNAIKRLPEGQDPSNLNEKIEAQSGGGSSCSRFALWGLHLDRFDAHLGELERHRPVVPERETPMAADLSPTRPRAQQITSFWRAHLLAGVPADDELLFGRIRAFFEEEKQLTERWGKLRRSDAEEPLSRALTYATQAAALLERIAREGGGVGLWPPFLQIDGAVVSDARALAERLHARARFVRERILT